MKKIILYSLTALSLLTLTGCAKTETQIMTTLKNQVKRVEKIVTISEKDDISSVSPVEALSYSGYSIIQNHKANSYNNMTRENQLKQEVLNLNSFMKSCLNKDIKLSKTKTKALQTLTSNISSNLSKYNDTKSEVKTSVKNIQENLKVSNIDVVNAESEYISLNGNMSERYVYLCNIYDNLEQAYYIICDNTWNNEQTNQQITENKSQTEETESSKSSNRLFRFKKNIDSYAPTIEDKIKETNDSNKEENVVKDKKNIDTFTNNVPPSKNNPNGYYPQYNYNNYGYNMPNGYGYGYYQNGYNGYYGYPNNNFRRFNPGSNTDTFYPNNRNIDTYRPNPNLNYPVSSSPLNADRTEEELVKENGVIDITKNNDNTNINTDIIEEDIEIAQ